STYEDLVRFLYRKVWDADRAQDLAQETFVRCMKSARPVENVRAFVFTIAINLARDEARSVMRRKKHLTLLETDSTVQPDFEREEKIVAVERALADLNDRDRDILLLWDAGLSYQEISAQTGLAIGAIG